MRGKGTRTAQLFVNTVNNARLDPEGFAPVGRVVGAGGMDAVDRINAECERRCCCPSSGLLLLARRAQQAGE